MKHQAALLQNDYWLSQIIDMGLIGTRFQPIVSLRENKVIGLEALSYGKDYQSSRIIPPGLLFSQAARENRILELDRVCREKALEAFQAVFRQNPNLLVWINIETSILDKNTLGSGRLFESAISAGIPPANIVIEIIESKLSDADSLRMFVETYRSHGFFIALDDVGTGHSNLERIALLKPDIMKIDRFLIRDIWREKHKYQVVRSLQHMAQGIGALVVAEGIEYENEALAVMDLGVNLHQGYFYARPGPLELIKFDEVQKRVTSVSAGFRSRHVDRFSRRRDYFNTIGLSVSDIASQLGRGGQSSFENVLGQAIGQDQNLECLYVLDQRGMQVTDTICNPCRMPSLISPLFRPAPKGADLSLKDYYLLIMAGLDRYVSEPYISRASGNLCVTISTTFNCSRDRSFILCADYDCQALRLD